MASRSNTSTPRRKLTVRSDNSPKEAARSTRSTDLVAGVHEDILVSLTNAYENKRARLVTEWELIGQRSLRQVV